jgi:regulator of sigma E protease
MGRTIHKKEFSMIIPISIFILILGVVIFIHELGHYLAARRAGIFVEEFALGMGPKIFAVKGKKQSRDGEVTLYSLRAFPIGGFCRMRGMDDEMPDDPEAMNNKPIPARILVAAGGSIMNFLLAFVLFFMLLMLQERMFPLPEIESISDNMPAYHAGLRVGDIITHIDNIPMETGRDVIEGITSSEGRAIQISVLRNGENLNFTIIPELNEGRYLIGIRQKLGSERVSLFEGVSGASKHIIEVIRGPFILLRQFISNEPMPEGGAVMGPIGLGGVVTEMYHVTIEEGIADMIFTMLFITAFINAALGVMNLLPLPALDGARIVFLLVEAVRRKRVPPEKEAMVHFVGLVLLLMLAVVIAYQDIARIIDVNNITG